VFSRAVSLISCISLSIFAFACGGASGASTEVRPAERAASDRPTPPTPGPKAPVTHPSDTPRIIFLGDSLTAGLGLDVEDSYPSLIQQRLDKDGYRYQVVNAGVSGDTTAGALRRVEWTLGEGRPRIMVVALGGNDGLRGLPPAELESNLRAIVEHCTGRGLTVVLAGMEAPPNNGPEYTAEFRQAYQTLARTHKLPLVPFLLEGVAGIPSLNQADGIHPNKLGARIVAETVWRVLEPLLTKDTA
jgi:acyl-CoA thioesterase I